LGSNALGRLKDRIGLGGFVVAAIILLAVAFIAVSAMRDLSETQVDTSAGHEFPCTVESVYDGDGPINCTEKDLSDQPVRVRLRGIEARENDNSCQAPGICPNATGQQAKEALTRLATGRLTCTSFGPSYSRVDASCRNSAGQDLSCEMVRSGNASRWPQYDPEGRLAPCVPQPR
jgi:endonuclease YncB( thermonuclease family)